ncbi:hypothetical protein [Natrinema altunense]|uniref:Uncharacterized protein n=1 Tax=Natrinema altunense TaxID=222984 RepID=A0A482XUW8_9EURY|nr:hypothetical protein [Natrinema altunense]RZH67128.1 hypothetical protein ELS17_15315 [Natrinema altunense]
MARTRALLTQTEREWLESDETESGSRRYQVVSEVRNRIEDELTEDVTVLAENHPDLLEELRDVVCKNDE